MTRLVLIPGIDIVLSTIDAPIPKEEAHGVLLIHYSHLPSGFYFDLDVKATSIGYLFWRLESALFNIHDLVSLLNPAVLSNEVGAKASEFFGDSLNESDITNYVTRATNSKPAWLSASGNDKNIDLFVRLFT